MTTPHDHALDLEARTVQSLMDAATLLLNLQVRTQPQAAADIRQRIRNAAELELQVRLGPHPSLRLVCIGGDGAETALIRALDLQLAPRAG